jgi:Tfp pilus assembly protein PilF
MQVIRYATHFSRLAVLALLLIGSACQLPQPVPDNRYQRIPDHDASTAATISQPVRQLHHQALAAINEDQYALASDYLQRAIRIEPRNGWSWYYLADIHWRQGQLERCRSMLQRANAYAQGDARLVAASADLQAQCR